MSNNIHFIDKDWSVLNKLVVENNYSKLIVLIVGFNTLQHCLPFFSPVLEQNSFQVIRTGEAGEANKVFVSMVFVHTFGKLILYCGLWKEAPCWPTCLIRNQPYGVVSDLGGFIASIYKKEFHSFTFLILVCSHFDASIGGNSCGIDFWAKTSYR